MNTSPKTINDSAHFKAILTTAMRRRLIDRARKIIARKKRLGERADFEDAHQAPLDDGAAGSVERAMPVARSGKAMQESEVDDPRAARIIKLKNGDLTNEEIAKRSVWNKRCEKRLESGALVSALEWDRDETES